MQIQLNSFDRIQNIKAAGHFAQRWTLQWWVQLISDVNDMMKYFSFLVPFIFVFCFFTFKPSWRWLSPPLHVSEYKDGDLQSLPPSLSSFTSLIFKVLLHPMMQLSPMCSCPVLLTAVVYMNDSIAFILKNPECTPCPIGLAHLCPETGGDKMVTSFFELVGGIWCTVRSIVYGLFDLAAAGPRVSFASPAFVVCASESTAM